MSYIVLIYAGEESGILIKKGKKLLVFLFIVLVAITTLSILNYTSTKEDVVKSVEKDTNDLLYNFSNEKKRFISARITELELMSSHLTLLVDEPEEFINFIDQQSKVLLNFVALGFITPEGEVIASNGSIIPMNKISSFENTLDGETAISESYSFYQDPTQQVVSVTYPVYQEGEIIGAISGVVNMNEVLGNLQKKSSLLGAVYVMNGEETVYSSVGSDIYDALPHAATLMKGVRTRHSGSWKVDENNAHFIKYQSTWNDWLVVVDSGTNPKIAKINTSLRYNIFYIFIAVIIFIGVALYIRQLNKIENNRNKRDLLTGLGNRLQLEEYLARKIVESPQKEFALLYINIDRFKDINEKIGYQLGDRVLFEVSERLQQLAGPAYVYRVGGDEFIVISKAATEAEHKLLASSVLHLMEKPIELCEEHKVWITVSIGIRSSSAQGELDLMLQDGIFACQQAKKNGGNEYTYFTDELAAISGYQRLVIQNLDHALEKNEFYLLYQPIYCLTRDSVVSFETLMRWNSPVLGEIGPNDFIPLLEDSDLIIPVGRWLIREASEQAKSWEQQGYGDLIITVNISVKQLLHPYFVNDVSTIVKDVGVRTSMLVFEITETVAVHNIEWASQVLLTLQSMGIKTALDDFGTGYSSLSILKTMPIDYLKVDRAFVMEVESDDGVSRSILRGIIDIADSLKLTTIMEGVETIEQLNLLKEMGAHRIQGYYISKPVLPEKAIEYFKK